MTRRRAAPGRPGAGAWVRVVTLGRCLPQGR